MGPATPGLTTPALCTYTYTQLLSPPQPSSSTHRRASPTTPTAARVWRLYTWSRQFPSGPPIPSPSSFPRRYQPPQSTLYLPWIRFLPLPSCQDPPAPTLPFPFPLIHPFRYQAPRYPRPTKPATASPPTPEAPFPLIAPSTPAPASPSPSPSTLPRHYWPRHRLRLSGPPPHPRCSPAFRLTPLFSPCPIPLHAHARGMAV